MWTAQPSKTSDPRVLHYALEYKAQPASFAVVLNALQNDSAFHTFLNSTLSQAPFSAFRWETPGVTAATLNRPFEFVLIDAPNLTRRPESEAFAEHFTASRDDVLAFSNLGRDAIMIVPRPLGDLEAYMHLAAFVRSAPESQHAALWKKVGAVLSARVQAHPDRKVWLSTAGAGVAWLHVRLDDKPKYYGHEPYRKS